MLPSIFGENLFDEMFDDAFEMMPSFNHRNRFTESTAKTL